MSFRGIGTRTALRLLLERGREMLGVLHLFSCRADRRYLLSSGVPGAVAALRNPSRSCAGIAVCAGQRRCSEPPLRTPNSFGRASRKAERVRRGLMRSGGCPDAGDEALWLSLMRPYGLKRLGIAAL